MKSPLALSYGIAMCRRRKMRKVALKPLLTPHLIKGRIFTLDAMHTQRALCAQIHRFGGDYILIAKDNQPTLHEDSADLFEDRSPDRRRWKQAETWDKGHGRLEHRKITCSPDRNRLVWQGLARH
jgi:predicted transposase YbfD/YdcC